MQLFNKINLISYFSYLFIVPNGYKKYLFGFGGKLESSFLAKS